MEFFLRPDNASVWAEVQSVGQKSDLNSLQGYVTEAQRLTSSQRDPRIATQSAELEGRFIQPGNVVMTLLVSLSNHCKIKIAHGSQGRGGTRS